MDELKKYFIAANYEAALAVGETLLDQPLSAHDRRHVLYRCTLCARYLEQPALILKYYKLYSEQMPAVATIEQQIPFLHCKLAILFFIKQQDEALKLADSLLTTIKNMPNLLDYIYIYAATLHYKLLHFLDTGHYMEAVKTYNELGESMIEALEVSVPVLSLQIHVHLTSAYLRLGQWRTAHELVQAMTQISWIDDAPLVKPHLLIRQNLLQHILEGIPLSFEDNEALFLACQPMSRIALSVFLGDIAAMQVIAPDIAPLYTEWQRYLTDTPASTELTAYLM